MQCMYNATGLQMRTTIACALLLKHLYDETDQIEAAILPSGSLTTPPSIHRTILEASKRKVT